MLTSALCMTPLDLSVESGSSVRIEQKFLKEKSDCLFMFKGYKHNVDWTDSTFPSILIDSLPSLGMVDLFHISSFHCSYNTVSAQWVFFFNPSTCMEDTCFCNSRQNTCFLQHGKILKEWNIKWPRKASCLFGLNLRRFCCICFLPFHLVIAVELIELQCWSCRNNSPGKRIQIYLSFYLSNLSFPVYKTILSHNVLELFLLLCSVQLPPRKVIWDSFLVYLFLSGVFPYFRYFLSL